MGIGLGSKTDFSLGLKRFYQSIAIRSFAVSMINIFVPIYLIGKNHSFASALLFFIVLNVVHALFSLPCVVFARKHNPRLLLAMSIPLLVVSYLLLHSLNAQLNLRFFFTACLFGISSAFFWIGYHIIFSKVSCNSRRAEQVGIARIITSVACMAGPFVGGLLLSFLHFYIVFFIIIGILFISLLPLLLRSSFLDMELANVPIAKKELFKKKELKDYLAFFGFGMENGVGAVIWPLFLFGLFESMSLVGAFTSGSMVLTFFLTYLIGRFANRRKKGTLNLGASLNALCWTIKGICSSVNQFFFFDFLNKLSQNAMSMSFDALSYDKVNQKGIQFIANREVLIQLGKVALFGAVALSGKALIGFFMGAGASFLCLLF